MTRHPLFCVLMGKNCSHLIWLQLQIQSAAAVALSNDDCNDNENARKQSSDWLCLVHFFDVIYLIIYTKKLLNSDWLNKECKMCNTSTKSVIQCKLHIEILDYDWLMNKRVWSGAIFFGPIYFNCFQIKRAPWMAQFFPYCVISVRFFCLTISSSCIEQFSNDCRK